jgi:hypothetical protein
MLLHVVWLKLADMSNVLAAAVIALRDAGAGISILSYLGAHSVVDFFATHPFFLYCYNNKLIK